MKGFQKEETFNISLFSDFIFSRVNLTYTFLPGSSDMNRVFEAMNNRGKQLDHHELLKSRLLEKIESHERLAYSLIWDACSNMNAYVEKNIKDVGNLTWKNLYGDTSGLYEDDGLEKSKIGLDKVDIIKLLKEIQTNDKESISLKSILESTANYSRTEKDKNVKESDYLSKSVRRIISFPTFLLHVLRVYQLQNNGTHSAEVIDKKLLSIFDVASNFNTSEKTKEFILLIWKARVSFDKYIIKWVYSADEKEEYHEIEQVVISKSVIKNKDGSTNENISVQRVENTDEDIKCLSKLQGMLYHSQEMTTQYWITPFLYILINEQLSNTALLKKLEVLETTLFYSVKNTSKLKDRTFNIVFQNESEELECLVDSKSYLNKCLGTGYPNYIFYKLEYILWKDRVGICEEKGL